MFSISLSNICFYFFRLSFSNFSSSSSFPNLYLRISSSVFSPETSVNFASSYTFYFFISIFSSFRFELSTYKESFCFYRYCNSFWRFKFYRCFSPLTPPLSYFSLAKSLRSWLFWDRSYKFCAERSWCLSLSSWSESDITWISIFPFWIWVSLPAITAWMSST